MFGKAKFIILCGGVMYCTDKSSKAKFYDIMSSVVQNCKVLRRKAKQSIIFMWLGLVGYGVAGLGKVG